MCEESFSWSVSCFVSASDAGSSAYVGEYVFFVVIVFCVVFLREYIFFLNFLLLVYIVFFSSFLSKYGLFLWQIIAFEVWNFHPLPLPAVFSWISLLSLPLSTLDITSWSTSNERDFCFSFFSLSFCNRVKWRENMNYL